ncbi:MAG: glycerol-3-phosphate acyltransferase, partial [Verrucomicrobiae bacterium]|nr:glycerol-3-phosphate acyltransferase [Verrucomicrobiae bacterium]
MPWLAPVLAYLAGSIPFGLLVARARGVDIREVGSGNIGATNVGRALGKKYAYLVFALDFGKGILGVWLARRVIGDALPSLPWWIVSSALATVLGHSFPIWLKFKGGKGVATSA